MPPTFRDAELSGWTARAENYDRMFTPISAQAIPPVVAALGEVRGRRVLDVCCGPGHLTAALVAAGAHAEGLDFAPTMVARARANHPGVAFVEGDAEKLPYPAAAFDHVVCVFGILHLERPEAAMAEARRVLKPGGRYVLAQWAKDDELLGIVGAAIAMHGDAPAGLPPAPPPLRFGDADECRRALAAAGFGRIEVGRIDIAWRPEGAEAVLELIRGSAVRAAMMIEAQPPERRARIEAAILAAAAGRRHGDTIVIRRPTVLACGIAGLPGG
jgi:SAM-dependent methyltransferase